MLEAGLRAPETARKAVLKGKQKGARGLVRGRRRLAGIFQPGVDRGLVGRNPVSRVGRQVLQAVLALVPDRVLLVDGI